MKKWDDLTHEEKKTCGNGCGPKYLKKKFPHLIPDLIFEMICREHDFYFIQGGGILTFLGGNIVFLGKMLIATAQNEDPWYYKPLYTLTAFGWFIWVMTLGALLFNWYNYKKAERE